MQVESLDNTDWDVVIAGTGLHQSLLALALSRSTKKVLHVDRNGYYGGNEAAFSLQEADEWVKDHAQILDHPAHIHERTTTGQDAKLSFSRAYSLALAPHLIYTQSSIIPKLVSSKAFRQLEFQAMGSWWIFTKPSASVSEGQAGRLVKMPTNREDIAFSDSSIDLKAKRSVMKVLRFIVDFENQGDTWHAARQQPFADFLRNHFKLSSSVLDLFLALTLSPQSEMQTSTEYALPRIARHLRSIGRLGPGFSSVIPKWGGMSEMAQVACRAGAVGGAVYVLNNAISDIQELEQHVEVEMSSGDKLRTSYLVGSVLDIPRPEQIHTIPKAQRSISIVASQLSALFRNRSEGTPPAAGAVVIFPGKSIGIDGVFYDDSVHLIIHTADTGECPKDQCIIYASTTLTDDAAPKLLDKALEMLLQDTCESQSSPPAVLWTMHYRLNVPVPQGDDASEQAQSADSTVLLFPAALSPDLVFDDAVLDRVRSVWRTVLELDPQGGDDDQFLVFDDREGHEDEDEAEQDHE